MKKLCLGRSEPADLELTGRSAGSQAGNLRRRNPSMGEEYARLLGMGTVLQNAIIMIGASLSANQRKALLAEMDEIIEFCYRHERPGDNAYAESARFTAENITNRLKQIVT